MAMGPISRRGFFKIATASVAATAAQVHAQTPTAERRAAPRSVDQAHAAAYQFFNAHDARFIEAAVERLIPPDETGPGALQAGVPSYTDKQLGGVWGAGERKS